MKPREIEVHIEELILHGFEPAHRWRIADGLQRRLEELLTGKGVPSLWFLNPERIEGRTIRSGSLSRPAEAGTEIAGAVYHGGTK